MLEGQNRTVEHVAPPDSVNTVIDGIWSVATTRPGDSLPALLRANGTEARTGFPVEISQQEEPASARCITGGICVPIMAQGGVFSNLPVAPIPNPHEVNPAAGIASRSIASTELTILKGRVIFLIGAYSTVSLAGCDGNHRPAFGVTRQDAKALKQQTGLPFGYPERS